MHTNSGMELEKFLMPTQGMSALKSVGTSVWGLNIILCSVSESNKHWLCFNLCLSLWVGCQCTLLCTSFDLIQKCWPWKSCHLFLWLHALQIHLTQLILSNVSLLIQGGKQSVDTRLTCFEHTIYLCFCKYCTAEVRKIDPKKNHLNSLFHSLALSWKGTVAELIID